MPATDWQTPAALLVVAITVLAFVWRAVARYRRKKSGGATGCGSCGCGHGGKPRR